MRATHPISFVPIVLFGEDHKILILYIFVQALSLLTSTKGVEWLVGSDHWLGEDWEPIFVTWFMVIIIMVFAWRDCVKSRSLIVARVPVQIRTANILTNKLTN